MPQTWGISNALFKQELMRYANYGKVIKLTFHSKSSFFTGTYRENIRVRPRGTFAELINSYQNLSHFPSINLP